MCALALWVTLTSALSRDASVRGLVPCCGDSSGAGSELLTVPLSVSRRPDLEHLLPRALSHPAHGRLLHLHGDDLQRLLLQGVQHLWLFLECPAHVPKWHMEVSLQTETGHSLAIQGGLSDSFHGWASLGVALLLQSQHIIPLYQLGVRSCAAPSVAVLVTVMHGNSF